MKLILNYQLLFHQLNKIKKINSYLFDRDNQSISNMNYYFIKNISNFRTNDYNLIINNLHLINK